MLALGVRPHIREISADPITFHFLAAFCKVDMAVAFGCTARVCKKAKDFLLPFK